MDYETKKVFLVNLAVLAVGVVLSVLAVKFVIGYLLPFVVGALLAVLVKRPARYLSAKTRTRSGGWSVLLVLVLYAVGVSLIGLFVWQLLVQAGNLAEMLPGYFGRLESFFDGVSESLSDLTNRLPPKLRETAASAFESTFRQMFSSLTGFLTNTVTTVVKGIPAVLFSAVITVVASCYIAVDSEHLLRFVRELLKPATYKKLLRIRDIFSRDILKYILGYVILTAIAFCELLAGFWLLRVKYAVLIAAVTAFIDLLPVFGTGTVLLPWAVCAFAFGDGRLGLGLLVLYLVICVVRYFIEPRIIGKRVGVNPLLTLAAMFVGLRIGGLPGLLLLPVGCIVVVHYYKQQLEEERTGGKGNSGE